MTAELTAAQLDLAAFIRPGDHVLWGQACAEPTTLVEALIAQRAALGGVNVFLGSSFSATISPEHADHLKFSGIGIGSNRRLTKAGALQITPCHVGQIGSYLSQGLIGCDVLLLQLSPPDESGRHSFGAAADYIGAAIARARVVIGEVNDQTPVTHGELGIKHEDLDAVIHTSRALIEVPAGGAGSASEQAIAGHAARYIRDGATLQIGVGAIPDAIAQRLADRRDLGVHSGMLGDALVDLIERGIVTNERKPLDRGRSVAGLLIGTRRVFQFAHDNPKLSMRSSAYTHGEAVLAALPDLVTVNSALEVDLSGQVNAEALGADYIGGIGGQADYVRAGQRSRGGCSIITLPATSKNGDVSRICIRLSGPVTNMRGDTDVIVTEFGAAELRGATIAGRAKRLAAIAHPDFRESLEREAAAIAKRGF